MFDDLFDEPNARAMYYQFQHQSLRRALFESHPELMIELSNDEPFDMPLLHFWSRAEFYCDRAGDLLDDDQTIYPESINRTHQENFGQYQISVYSMPEPLYPTECRYVVFVLNTEDEHVHGALADSSMYFTYERIEGQPHGGALCQWLADGRHTYIEDYEEQDLAFLVELIKSYLVSWVPGLKVESKPNPFEEGRMDDVEDQATLNDDHISDDDSLSDDPEVDPEVDYDADAERLVLQGEDLALVEKLAFRKGMIVGVLCTSIVAIIIALV